MNTTVAFPMIIPVIFCFFIIRRWTTISLVEPAEGCTIKMIKSYGYYHVKYELFVIFIIFHVQIEVAYFIAPQPKAYLNNYK